MADLSHVVAKHKSIDQQALQLAEKIIELLDEFDAPIAQKHRALKVASTLLAAEQEWRG